MLNKSSLSLYNEKDVFEWSYPSRLYNILKLTVLKLTTLTVILGPFYASEVLAQSNEKKNKLFEADSGKLEDARKKQAITILKGSEKVSSDELKFKAASVDYDKEKGVAKGAGGILVSRAGVQVQAESGSVNTTTKDGEFSGNMIVTGPEGGLTAESGTMNLETELGTFNNARFSLEPGPYKIFSGVTKKLSEFEYELKKATFTTCDCDDDFIPWQLESDRADITQEGYAYSYGTTFRFYDVPIMYTPFFAFPAKMQRASGLLSPDIGFSRRDGFKYRQPLYLVLGESADMTLAPFTETSTRTGISVGYKQKFSMFNTLDTRWYFSDESARGDSLRGIVQSGPNAPTFDKNRIGGFMSHTWTSDRDIAVPLTYLADIHYVGDDLFLREIGDEDIGERTARYTSSRVMMTAGLGEYITSSIAGEYNQSINSTTDTSDDPLLDDDRTLQRLPEFRVDGLRSWRPFGSNEYGLKAVTSGSATITEFSRREGMDGTRTHVDPAIGIPFHVSNYVNGQLRFVGYDTTYDLNEIEGSVKENSSDRQTFMGQYTMSTELDRVYEVERDSFLSAISSLGALNQGSELVRVKHSIVPMLGFTYVPDIAGQDNLPLFDSIDRIRARRLVTYGFTTSLSGRFDSARSASTIEEIAPRPEDVPMLDYSSPFISSGDPFSVSGGRYVGGRGEVRSLADFTMRQSYDFYERDRDIDPGRRAFSDVSTGLRLSPTKTFSFVLDNTIRPRDKSISSWGTSVITRDDRGDVLRLRYSFTDPENFDAAREEVFSKNVSYLETSSEFVLTDAIKLGYYARYDAASRDFIENAGALRFQGSCNCWYIDVGVSERTNPDNQQYNIRFGVPGLGDLRQGLFARSQSRSVAGN